MKAILFWVAPGFRLTGSTINVVEYFLAGFEHNPDLKLYLLDGTNTFRNKLLNLIFEKYDLTGIGILNAIQNIICLKKHYLPTKRFDTILILDYMTIAMVRGIINVDNVIVISEKFTENPQFFLKKDLYNVEYYGEMNFHYRDHEYRMKCLFDRYKPLKEVRDGTYVNSPKNIDIEYDFDSTYFRKKYGLPTPFFFKSKTEPEENLFEKFTHYLYYHVDKWFDPHPRLFLECCFYDKIILYHNPLDIRDGSWYRYHDVMKNGVEGRTLNKDDEIIRRMI